MLETFVYFHYCLFLIDFQPGISNMQELPYVRIFKVVNHVRTYFQSHSLFYYRDVVLTQCGLNVTDPLLGKFMDKYIINYFCCNLCPIKWQDFIVLYLYIFIAIIISNSWYKHHLYIIIDSNSYAKYLCTCFNYVSCW